MKRTTTFAIALLGGLTLMFAVGCEKVDDHDHGTTAGGDEHAHAESLGAAVEELEMLYTRLDMSVSGNEVGELDNTLHDIAHVVDEEMPELIAKSELSDEDKTKASETAAKVMKLYSPLHDALHGNKAEDADLSVYTNVKDEIKAAVEELCALAGHDHDDEDGDADHKDGDGDKHDDDAKETDESSESE